MGGDYAPGFQQAAASATQMYGSNAFPEMHLDFNAGLYEGNPFVGMLGNAALAQGFGAAGMMPSRFFPVQNLYDQYRDKQFFQERSWAMTQGAQADRSTYVNVLRGISRMTGRPYTNDMERAAQTMAGGIAGVAPFMAMMMPDTWDSMHGSRGSAAVMAMGLHRGGRIGIDPVTGLTGVSGASAGAMAAQIQQRFFGPEADISAFRGLSMGRLGGLYEEMQQRGIAGPSLGGLSADKQYDALTADRGFLASQLAGIRERGGRGADVIGNLAGKYGSEGAITSTTAGSRELVEQLMAVPDAKGSLLRGADAKKVIGRLENLAGTVSAMRDIFGDSGRPNAPMRELINGLEQLTQGGLATQSPAQLEKSVRMTQALARSTGIGIDGTQALMARGAGITDALGLDRQFAVLATQGAMSFGQAFGQSGISATPHFQAGSREEMTVIDQRLRAQAAKSGMANQLNTALRLDAMGGLTGPGAQFVAAIKSGQTTFGPNGESVFQDEAAFRTMMVNSGVRPEEVGRVLFQRTANQQYGAQYNTGGLVRDNAQRKTITDAMYQSSQPAAGDLVRRLVGDGPHAERIANAVAHAASSAVMDMDATVRRDDAARTGAVAKSIKATLQAQGVDTRGMSDADLTRAADSMWGGYTERVKNDPRLQGYRTALISVESQDKQLLDRKRAVDDENRITGLMRSTLAGIGQAGPLARIVDAIQQPGTSLMETLGKALGGVTPEVFTKELEGLKGMTVAQMDAKGISSKHRLALMTGELAKIAGSFDSAKRITDPEERNRALAGLQEDAAAIEKGGATAQERANALRHNAGGISKLTPEQFARYQALSLAAGHNLETMSQKAGVDYGVQVGADQVGDLLKTAGRAGTTGADQARHAGVYAAGVNEVMGATMGNATQIESLGAGGLTLVRDLNDKRLQLQQMADKLTGGDVGKLLASGNPEAMAVKESLDSGLRDYKRRREGPHDAMGDTEKAETKKFLESQSMPEADRNKALIARMVGKANITVAQRTELEGMLGRGGDAARAAVERGLKARERLDGLDVLDDKAVGTRRQAAARGESMGWSDDDQIAREGGAFLRYGSGKDDEMQSFTTFKDVLKSVGAKEEDDDSGSKNTTKVVGTLELKDPTHVLLTARTEPSGSGSTPAGPAVG